MGTRRTIGYGKETLIWADPWIDMKPARPIIATTRPPPEVQPQLSTISKFKDLLVHGGREWNEDLLRLAFNEEDRHRILEIRPGGMNSRDRFSWDYTKSGHYTVKSVYWVLTNIPMVKEAPHEVTQPSLDALFQLA